MRGIGGEVEAAIMNVAWSTPDPLSVREVLERLNANRTGRELAYTTVLTVMGNLARKGLLDQHRDGRAFRYSAPLSREEYAARVMNSALAGAEDRSAALLHFANQLDPKDQRALLDHFRAGPRRRQRKP